MNLRQQIQEIGEGEFGVLFVKRVGIARLVDYLAQTAFGREWPAHWISTKAVRKAWIIVNDGPGTFSADEPAVTS